MTSRPKFSLGAPDRLVEIEILQLQEERGGYTGDRDIERDGHAAAHSGERLAQRLGIEGCELGDRDEHQDKADGRSEQREAQQRFGDEYPDLFPAAQLIREGSQKQRLVNAPPLLCARLRHKVGDMPGDDTVLRHAVRIARKGGEKRMLATQHFAEGADLRYLRRDEPCLHQAMQAGKDEQGKNERRNMGPVGLQHDADKAEPPQHNRAETGQRDDDEPAQQRQEIPRFRKGAEQHR